MAASFLPQYFLSLLHLCPVKCWLVLFGHLQAVVVCPCVEAAFLKGKTREGARFCALLWSGVSPQPERMDWRNVLVSTEIPKKQGFTCRGSHVCSCVCAHYRGGKADTAQLPRLPAEIAALMCLITGSGIL